MDDLEQSLENLDELRKEAKDYANTLVLPNDERIELDKDEVVDRQAELLKQRDEQESKWNEEIEKAEELKKEQVYIPSSERYDKNVEQEQEDRTKELLKMRDEQEAKWKHDSSKSLIGKITRKVQEKLNGNQEKKESLLNSNFYKEVADATYEADQKLSQIDPIEDISKIDDTAKFTESQIVNLEQNDLIDNIPASALEQIKDEELLFSMEKENSIGRTLKPNNNGSIFSSVLIILTTLTVGIIAAVMVLK